jgi:hypothetical protein
MKMYRQEKQILIRVVLRQVKHHKIGQYEEANNANVHSPTRDISTRGTIIPNNAVHYTWNGGRY